MNQSHIIKIAIFSSLMGILILLYISETLTIPSSNINKLNNSKLDLQVIIKGTVTSIQNNQGLSILNLKDSSSTIKVVIFNKETINLQQGDIIEVQGILTEYNGKREIIAKKVVKF